MPQHGFLDRIARELSGEVGTARTDLARAAQLRQMMPWLMAIAVGILLLLAWPYLKQSIR